MVPGVVAGTCALRAQEKKSYLVRSRQMLGTFFSSALERLCLFSLPQSSTARDFGGHHCFAERAPSRTAFFTASFVESLQLLREALTPSIAGRPAPRVVRKTRRLLGERVRARSAISIL